MINAALISTIFLSAPGLHLSTSTRHAARFSDGAPLEQRSEVQEKIQNIPLEDQEILEEFFRNLLFFRGFAYTLFGDKPISVENFDLDNPEKPQLFRTSSHGYKTWEKYAHLFPQQHYIFLFYEDSDEDFCEVTLINKKALQQVVDLHKEKFVDFFGSEFDSDELLGLLMQKRSLWNTSMEDRDDLIGILLGYGKVNAELFQKRNEILRRTARVKKKRTEPSRGYHSIDEELAVLNASLQSFSNEERISLRLMSLPGFVADRNHADTVKLRRRYVEQRKRITQRYSHGNVLEITLEQLSRP